MTQPPRSRTGTRCRSSSCSPRTRTGRCRPCACSPRSQSAAPTCSSAPAQPPASDRDHRRRGLAAGVEPHSARGRRRRRGRTRARRHHHRPPRAVPLVQLLAPLGVLPRLARPAPGRGVHHRAPTNFQKAAELIGRPDRADRGAVRGHRRWTATSSGPTTPVRRRPTVLFLGGADSWAEELYFLGGTEFPARGLNVVMVDTPGRGELAAVQAAVQPPGLRGAGRAVLDFLEERERRRRGPDRPRRRELRRLLRAPGCRLRASGQGSRRVVWHVEHPHGLLRVLSAAAGAAAVAERARRTTQRPVRSWRSSPSTASPRSSKIPVYVMHGTDDIIMDIKGAHRFVDALTTDDVTVDIYDGAGSLHCSYDYFSRRHRPPGATGSSAPKLGGAAPASARTPTNWPPRLATSIRERRRWTRVRAAQAAVGHPPTTRGQDALPGRRRSPCSTNTASTANSATG